MAEVIVRFDLKFSDKAVRLAMVGAMLLAAAPELASESVSLTTYYPAPSGVYTQIIGTSNSYMARDTGVLDVGTSAAQSGSTKLVVMGGNVGIGTTAPVAGTQLAVVGGNVGIGTTSAANALQVVGSGGGNVDASVNGRIQTGDASGAGGVWLDNPGTMFIGQDGTSLGLYTSGAGWAEVMAQNGTVAFTNAIGTYNYSPTSNLPGGWVGGLHTYEVYAEGAIGTGTGDTVQTELSNNGGIYSTNVLDTSGGANCNSISINANSSASCGGYVTVMSGVYTYYVVPPVFQNQTGATIAEHIDALCCPCPVFGCNL